MNVLNRKGGEDMRFNVKVEMIANRVVCGEKNYPDCELSTALGHIINEMAAGSVVTISTVIETVKD